MHFRVPDDSFVLFPLAISFVGHPVFFKINLNTPAIFLIFIAEVLLRIVF